MKIEDSNSLGPATSEWLVGIGINSLEELKQRDLIDVYAELKLKGYPVTKNFVIGAYGAVHDINWRMVDQETKMKLYKKIDDLVDEREQV